MSIKGIQDSGLRSVSPSRVFSAAAYEAPIQWGNFSNASTGTYSANGLNWKYVRFTGASTLNVVLAGFLDILVVGGGGGSSATGPYGGGGQLIDGYWFFSVGDYTVTIGAGGAASDTSTGYGGDSYLGSLRSGQMHKSGMCARSGYRPGALSLAYRSAITGTTIEYGLCRDSFSADSASAVVPRANYGDGGGVGASTAGSGTAGVVIVRTLA